MSERVNTEVILSDFSEELQQLDFVEWDRYTGGKWSEEHNYISIYGWIPRNDGYKDFVEIIRWDDGGIYFTTSSARYTEQIHQILFDEPVENHNECKRVENAIDIPNVVELSDK